MEKLSTALYANSPLVPVMTYMTYIERHGNLAENGENTTQMLIGQISKKFGKILGKFPKNSGKSLEKSWKILN